MQSLSPEGWLTKAANLKMEKTFAPIPICHCSRCHSKNTVRTDQGRRFDCWYCYDCGRSFEVPTIDGVEHQLNEPARVGSPLAKRESRASRPNKTRLE